MISILTALAAGILLLAGCEKDTDLQERVDTLESKVAMLETSIAALNSNIDALSVLASGATINSVEESGGKYTITLTNGETITINQGSVGVGYAPIMSVDKDGYWMADYQDGKGAQYITDADGKKVNYKGDNGITPKFSVDKDGYWTVSYDGGQTFEQVKDAGGNPVKAVASTDAGDSYFKDVKVEDDVFILTLKNGDVYRVPVVKDFLVSVKDVETVQVFKAAEQKAFTVEMKGVASSVLSAPEGWTATLSESLLTVTAPAATKSTIADNSTDVSILAISTQGYAAIAKVKVQLDGSSTGGAPVASITAGEVTYNQATFNVTTENATAWTYICQKSSEEAPGIARILTAGIAGSGTSVTVTGLDEKTSYTIYVLPQNGDNLGSIATAEITTSAEPVITYEDNYTAYMEGKAIDIAGIKYDKATYGEPVLLSATTADTDARAAMLDGGVLFLEQSDGCNFTLSNWVNVTKGLVVIGRYTSKPVTLNIPASYYICFNNAERLVFKNVKFDGTKRANYVFNSNVNTAGNLHFDNCQFYTYAGKSFYYAANATQHQPNSVRFVSCYIDIPNASGARSDFFSFGNTSCPLGSDLKEITYDNNIFYASLGHGNAGISLLAYGNATNASVEMNLDLTLTNNTFCGCLGSNNMFQINSAKTVTIRKNIFWAAPAATLNSYVVRIGVNVQNPVCDIADNIAYSRGVALFNTGGKYKLDTGNNATKIDDDPLADATPASGDFTPIAAYKDYGAQR